MIRPKHRWLTARFALTAWVLAMLTLSASYPTDRLEGASRRVRHRLAKKVTLTFKDIGATEALKILSEQAHINMTIDGGVRGSVTVYLTDVDVATALDLVAEMTGNAYFVQGDIIRVLPEEDYIRQTGNPFRVEHSIAVYPLQNLTVEDAADALGRLNIITSNGQVHQSASDNSLVIWDVPETHARVRQLLDLLDQPGGGVETAVIELQHIATEEMVPKVTPHLTPTIGSAELLGVGDRIAVTDLPSRIPALKELIANLDVPRRQVLMEVKVLQVSHSEETSTGIDWAVVQDELNSLHIQSAHSVLPKTSTGDVGSGTVLTIGNMEDDDFNVIMEALETFGSTEIVSMPRVLAVSGTDATIHVGSSEPYVTVNTRESSGVINYYETVTHVAVGVKLDVTPLIHPDDFITMTVRPEVSSVSRFETTTSGNSIPVVEQSTMQTEVRVKSGVYIILGGLMKKEQREANSGIPILRSIPLLKYFFSSTTLKEFRSELVVMIRPTIVAGDAEIELEED